jgi:hypothetical protein
VDRASVAELDSDGVAGGQRPDRGDEVAVAAMRLGRPCTRSERTGRVEREVVAAAEAADPISGRAASAPPAASSSTMPLPILLVWPETAPGIAMIPTPPHHR